MLLDQDSARDNAGLADSASVSHGNGRTNNNASGSSLEVGGYQVYYDLLSEERLRAWKAQGMKELFIPLPGTEYQMVCPLEVALRRGSSKCRLLPPDSPELKDIGDARKAIIMMDVYHEGERLWHGPGRTAEPAAPPPARHRRPGSRLRRMPSRRLALIKHGGGTLSDVHHRDRPCRRCPMDVHACVESGVRRARTMQSPWPDRIARCCRASMPC
jgi:hypothetical protein